MKLFHPFRRSATAVAAAFVLSSISMAAAPASPEGMASSPSVQVLDHVLRLCDEAEKRMPMAILAGETIAERHLKGGAIGAWWENGCLGPELYGRSGNIVHIGYDRVWKKDRTDSEKTQDTALIGMEWPPWNTARRLISQESGRSTTYIIGFGPKAHPDLAGDVAACNLFFDTGFGENDQVAVLDGGLRAGHLNHVANALHGWMVMAETTAALTRGGRMPTMWKSYSYADARDWGALHLGKNQFHADLEIPPQPPGALAKAYLDQIRLLVGKLKLEQIDNLNQAAELIAAENSQGRRTVVAWAGHMPEAYVGRIEDRAWAQPVQLHLFLDGQRQNFMRRTPNGALVLILGSQGLDPHGPPMFREKGQRLLCMTGRNHDPEWQMPPDSLVNIDLQWPFGDACVEIEGYPFPVFAPSGIMQAAAYSALCAQVEWLRTRPPAGTPPK